MEACEGVQFSEMGAKRENLTFMSLLGENRLAKAARASRPPCQMNATFGHMKVKKYMLTYLNSFLN